MVNFTLSARAGQRFELRFWRERMVRRPFDRSGSRVGHVGIITQAPQDANRKVVSDLNLTGEPHFFRNFLEPPEPFNLRIGFRRRLEAPATYRRSRVPSSENADRLRSINATGKRTARSTVERAVRLSSKCGRAPLVDRVFPAFRRSLAPARRPRVTRGVPLKAATFRS